MGSLKMGRRRYDNPNQLSAKSRKIFRDAGIGDDRGSSSGWTPRYPGTTEDGDAVTFREGLGDNEGHTLISDGEKSARAFDREHNHYGDNREGGGRVEDEDGDRGFYTGPGS